MEEPKFNVKRLLITTGFVVLAALAVGGTTWYVMDANQKKDAQQYEKQIQELEEQKNQEKTETKESNETANWKTFQGTGFTIKYPSNWVFKDYSKLAEGSKMVGFADVIANLAPEQSDGHSVVDAAWGTDVYSEDDLTTSLDKLTKTTVKIGNLNGNKYTLAAGRPNDMNGESKLVIYQIELSDGSYLTITNTDDREKEIFEKMVLTVK